MMQHRDSSSVCSIRKLFAKNRCIQHMSEMTNSRCKRLFHKLMAMNLPLVMDESVYL